MSFDPGIQTKYDSILALAELPWFELRRGRLALADRRVGPILDIHTHLALANLPFAGTDLQAERGAMQHFLPLDGPLDLDRYMNQNFTEDGLDRLKRELVLGRYRRHNRCVTHTVPNLLQEMDDLDIRFSVVLAIDLPVVAHNARRFLAATRRQERLICFGSIHPFQLGRTWRLDRQIRRGSRGLKVHPGGQLVAPAHPRAMKLYRLCGERGLPVFFHCGPVGIELERSARLSQVDLYEEAVAENPGTTFVLGHSGALQMEQALRIAQRYPNVYLDLACQAISNIATILDEADPDRILNGSDWPLYHQAVGVAKVLLLTEERPELRRKVLYDNAARLLSLV